MKEYSIHTKVIMIPYVLMAKSLSSNLLKGDQNLKWLMPKARTLLTNSIEKQVSLKELLFMIIKWLKEKNK